jgi:hypothetical protein
MANCEPVTLVTPFDAAKPLDPTDTPTVTEHDCYCQTKVNP